jgi:hypothetical protein
MTRPHTFILDGFLGRPRRWETLRAAIEDRVGPATIHRYDCSGLSSLEDLGAKLAATIRSHGTGSNPVNLIGYSMGGLVIRWACLSDPDLPIRRVVFMNSPHEGSWLACLLPLTGIRQMRPFDPHMQRVREQPWNVPTLTIWNPVDGVILPGKNTRFDRAGEQVRCAVPLHIWPVWSRDVRRRVVEFLGAEENAVGGGLTTRRVQQLSS